MKPWQFIVSLVLGVVCVGLAISLIFLGKTNSSLQQELGKQQEEINKGGMSQQVGTRLVREMASASVQDDEIRDVLKKNGVTVNVNANGSAAK